MSNSHESNVRLYFMGGHATPLVDPRDIPRNSAGYPVPKFGGKLEKHAVQKAVTRSFLDLYVELDDSCFEVPVQSETKTDQPKHKLAA